MNRLIGALAPRWRAPSGLRAADKVDFTKEIRPIFQQNCVKCHGPEKQKAKLRLDSKAAAMKRRRGPGW